MGTELKLKLRDRADTLPVPVSVIANWLELDEEKAKDAMHEFFKPLKGTNPRIHDKVFYERTINWSPIMVTERGNVAKGIPAMEQIRWHRIGRELLAIKDDREGSLDLRSKDVDLIWKRWSDPEFKTESMYSNPWIFDCMLDFMEATNRWPDDEEESLRELLAKTKGELPRDEGEEDPQLEEVKVPVSIDGDH
jgi:hypothetical protein